MQGVNTAKKIEKLRKEQNAVIVAHYYQPPDIQDMADFVGDSLELSRFAQRSDSEMIVFCGVGFMAETAKILQPKRTVLLPVEFAGCLMADMVTAAQLKELKDEHPKAAVVCYVNSSAEIKAVSDICCTSSNAVRVVRSMPQEEIIFVPDRNLGRYIARFIPEKKFYYSEGFCPVHNDIVISDVISSRRNHPEALLLVHPECSPEIIDSADYTGSTSQIIRYVAEKGPGDYLIGTESGILHQLKKVSPESVFHTVRRKLVCNDMKLISAEDVLLSLDKVRYPVEVDPVISERALRSISRMMEVG